MRVDPDSPLAEDLKKLKEKEGKDHILMSVMFKVGQKKLKRIITSEDMISQAGQCVVSFSSSLILWNKSDVNLNNVSYFTFMIWFPRIFPDKQKELFTEHVTRVWTEGDNCYDDCYETAKIVMCWLF